MLLIYPPVAKASEPPAGVSLLAGALQSRGIRHTVLDMNLGAQEYLLDRYFLEKPKKRNYLEQLRNESVYQSTQRYGRAIQELTTGLNYGIPRNIRITLSNYSDTKYDPLKSADLLQAATLYRDSPFLNYYRETLEPLREALQKNPIGISLQFIQQSLPAFALIGFLKSYFPENPILLGGGLINSWGSLENWKNPFGSLVDQVFLGSGEEQLLQYLGSSPSDRSRFTQPGDYSWTRELRYFSPGAILPLAGSSGCGWKRCSFCPERSENAPYHSRNPQQVLEEKREMEETYSPRLIHFLDNEISPALLKALSEADRGSPWYGFTKFYPLLKEKDFCLRLKEKGCAMLKLGLESGDQQVLDQMDKGIRLEDVSPILRNLQEAGINTYIYLLFGTPEEDIHSARKTLKFVEENASAITYLNAAIFNMPLEGEIPEQSDSFLFSDADLSLYQGFNHPKGWNRGEIRTFLRQEFRRSPQINAILKRTPPQFNANHAALFSKPAIL